MRWLIGIGAGIVAGVLLLLLVQAFGDLLYPLPQPDGAIDPREQAQLIPDQPFPYKIIVLLAWFGGALVGAGVAIRLGGRRLFAFAVATAVVIRNVFAMSAIAYPGWMWFAAILLPFGAAWLAWRYMPLRSALPQAIAVPTDGPGSTWH